MMKAKLQGIGKGTEVRFSECTLFRGYNSWALLLYTTGGGQIELRMSFEEAEALVSALKGWTYIPLDRVENPPGEGK